MFAWVHASKKYNKIKSYAACLLHAFGKKLDSYYKFTI